MVRLKNKKGKPNGSSLIPSSLKLMLILIASLLTVIVIFQTCVFSHNDDVASQMAALNNIQSPLDSIANKVRDVEEKCKKLPKIRSSGLSFPNVKRIHNVNSLEGIEPSFHFGSMLDPKSVPHHMKGDIAMFTLIKEHVSKANNIEENIAFDIGANQGFFTYYLATLGLTLHSFEIDVGNFLSLSHGLFYNPKEVADRVNLYPVGLSDKVARIGMEGGQYAGFLKQSNDENDPNDVRNGNILSVTFDCLQYHTQLNLDKISHVKIDVEGFEIAVLKGAKRTLFDPLSPRHNSNSNKNKKIGSLLMEVGPSRWSRANIEFDDGVQEMKNVGTNFFENAYVLLRFEGTHAKTCHVSLADTVGLSDKHPRVLGDSHVHKLLPHEWDPLFAEMNKMKSDCNFWFTNEQ